MAELRWTIGDVHRVYGEVGMIGTLGGERYVWFVKDGDVAMIPEAFLDDGTKSSREGGGEESGSK